MKNKVDEMIYLISIIDCLVEGNTHNKIDLGIYELEYLAKKEERITIWLEEGGIPSIQLQVLLRNKKTKKIEWADIFYKSLKKYKYKDLYNLDLQDKLNFIFRTENFITQKKYSSSLFVIPSDFLDEIPTYVDITATEHTVMPSNISKDGIAEIRNYLKNILIQINENNNVSNNYKLK